MSRDEVPAEVRALATTCAAKFISKDDNDFAELHGLFCAAIRAALASRPAAPATDAEGDRLQKLIEALEKIATAQTYTVNHFAVCFPEDTKDVARDAVVAAEYARPAPAPQAVEEVRRAREAMLSVLIQADRLRHYSRQADETLPTVVELQAGHFEDIAVRLFPDLQHDLDALRSRRAQEAADRQRARAEGGQ